MSFRLYMKDYDAAALVLIALRYTAQKNFNLEIEDSDYLSMLADDLQRNMEKQGNLSESSAELANLLAKATTTDEVRVILARRSLLASPTNYEEPKEHVDSVGAGEALAKFLSKTEPSAGDV